MKIGIGFARSKVWSHKLGCRLIRFAENSDVSHAFITVSGTTGEPIMIYEAVFPRVRVLHDHDWQKQYELVRVYDFEVPPDLKFWIGKDLRSWVGIPYPIMQLVLIASSIVMKFWRKWISQIVLNHDRSLICSELCAMLLRNYMAVDFKESLDCVGLVDLEKQLILLKQKEASGASVWISRD